MADFRDQDTEPMKKEIPGPIQLKAEGDPESAQKQLASTLMGKFNKWESWRRPLESVWTEIYRLFMSVSSVQKLPTRAKVSVPLVFQIIESALPKLVTVIFGQPEWFSAMSNSRKNPVPQEMLEAHEDLLKYQLHLTEFFQKFVTFCKQMFLYGTSYLFVYWKVQREWVYERTASRGPDTILGQVVSQNALTWEKKLVYKVVARRPEIEVLPIEDVWPDPFARDEEHAEGVFIASSVSMTELRELSAGPFPVYANFDLVEQMGAQSQRYQDQRFKLDRRTIRGTGQPTKTDSKDMVDILTFWGKWDLDGDGIRENVEIVIANRQVVIKAIRNPFEHQMSPLIRGVLFPVPLEWFGMGLIEPVIALIHELNTIRNQNIDMNNLILNRMWKVHAMADVDLDTLVSSPNGIIVTGDMDGVEPIAQDSIPVSPLQMSELIQGDIENTTVPKSLQGSPASGALGRTSSGAQLIISQALEKFGMGAKLIEETVVRKVLQMFIKLDAQFLITDEVLQYFYGDILKDRLAPEDIRAELDFSLLGVTETLTAEAAINQIVAFVNVWKGLPGVNMLKVAQEHWKLMKLKTQASDVIQPAPILNSPAGVALQNPAVSGGIEDAIVNQVANNGGGPIQTPQ